MGFGLARRGCGGDDGDDGGDEDCGGEQGAGVPQVPQGLCPSIPQRTKPQKLGLSRVPNRQAQPLPRIIKRDGGRRTTTARGEWHYSHLRSERKKKKGLFSLPPFGGIICPR